MSLLSRFLLYLPDLSLSFAQQSKVYSDLHLILDLKCTFSIHSPHPQTKKNKVEMETFSSRSFSGQFITFLVIGDTLTIFVGETKGAFSKPCNLENGDHV